MSLFLILDLILCSNLPWGSWSNFPNLGIPHRFSRQVLKLLEHVKLIMWNNRLISIDIFIGGGHRSIFLVQTDYPILMLFVFHRTLSYEIGGRNKVLDRVWFLWLVQIVMRFLLMRLLKRLDVMVDGVMLFGTNLFLLLFLRLNYMKLLLWFLVFLLKLFNKVELICYSLRTYWDLHI
jgi:hypothetical protein